MAGKALKKKILTEVADNGGVDWLYDQIASGITVADLARMFGCSRSYISRALNSIPEYKTALESAREEAADALVEQGLEMVNFRKFMAGSLNQNKYGTRPQNNVTISIGDMHLDALRKVNSQMAAIDAEDREREAIDATYEDVSDD
jgi:transcriptional regulator with XRE-family HTH domain